MANAVPQIRPVISTVSTINANPEGEMDALLLGRTRVSYQCIGNVIEVPQKNSFLNSVCLSSFHELCLYTCLAV